MNEDKLLNMLQARHSGVEWAFFRQVRNGTGFSATRTCDAIALNLWPSRGLELHGFEVKVSRNDWLRELKDPKKAEAVAKNCDRWWIVVADKEIVQAGELPPTWGLLVPRGEKLICSREAPKLEGQEPKRLFWASIIRCAKEYVANEAQTKAAYERGVETGLARGRAEGVGQKMELERLKETVSEFEGASGVKIDRWEAGRVGEAVKEFMRVKDIGFHRKALERCAKEFMQQAESLSAGAERIAQFEGSIG